MTARIRMQMGANALDATVESALVLVPVDSGAQQFRAYYVASGIDLSHMLAALIVACMNEPEGALIVARGVALSRQLRADHEPPFNG